VITYAPSTVGRDVSAVDVANSISYVTGATYAAPGELSGFSSVAAGSTVSGALTYNKRLQPLQLYYTTGTISSGTLTQLQTLACPTTTATIMSRAYIFGAGTNDNGNVQNIVNCRDGNRTQNFLYDSLNRIQQAYTTGSNWGETFSPTATAPGVPPTTSGIDAWGNLTNRSGVTGKSLYEGLSVAPASVKNQLNGYCDDSAGNLVLNIPCPQPPGTAFTPTYNYDAENRLTTTAGVTYTYDGDGQRVKKSNGTLYWGGTSSDALAETDLSGTLLEEYIYFNGKRVARREPAGSVRYYVSDHLGSASVITDSTGLIRSESDYYPYGGEIVITSGDTNHYKFTGKERDSESGLDNFGARYDSSALGRFMTPDWAARPTAVPYAVFGDPVS
jgi:RHS repeat-associated protein